MDLQNFHDNLNQVNSDIDNSQHLPYSHHPIDQTMELPDHSLNSGHSIDHQHIDIAHSHQMQWTFDSQHLNPHSFDHSHGLSEVNHFADDHSSLSGSHHFHNLSDSHQIQRLGSESNSELLKKAEERQKWANESLKDAKWNQKTADSHRQDHVLGAEGYDRTARDKMADYEKYNALTLEVR